MGDTDDELIVPLKRTLRRKPVKTVVSTDSDDTIIIEDEEEEEEVKEKKEKKKQAKTPMEPVKKKVVHRRKLDMPVNIPIIMSYCCFRS